LVVDDSVVVRQSVAEALASDPELEVVGTAANGRLALARIPQLNPDVVTLDIEMPEMDGLATLAAIRRDWPKLPVIMFSTVTTRGGLATLDALALGATDYVTKPSMTDSRSAALERVRADLIPRIRVFAGRPAPEARPPSPPAQRGGHRPPPARVDIVAIGASTGGPDALSAVLSALPADFPVPILVVQHMPPLFTRLLADRLGSKTVLEVREASAASPIEAGQVWIAPGDHHLALDQHDRRRLALHQGPPENSCRPAVDVLFRSVATGYGSHALGLVLTGMGRDGLRGAEALDAAGGRVLVQDEATSVVWGMPGFVAHAGLADQVLPLAEVAAELTRRAAIGRRARQEVPWA
jgi:two-component system chemotaxis response regulator CheB